MTRITTRYPITSQLKNQHYSIIPQKEFLIPNMLLKEKREFEKSWKNLKKDNYLKNGKSFRYRRFRYFHFLPTSQKITPFAATPYYQPPEINLYAEGIDRKFSEIPESTLLNTFFQELIKFDFLQLPVKEKSKSEPWLIDIHQVRIVSTETERGEPTPEGIHHDENDFVCIHLIKRDNIAGGFNGIYTTEKELLTSCTLTENLDSIILRDPEVMHGVSPIYPANPKNEGYRDVLLIGFTHAPNLPAPISNSLIDYQAIKKNINPPILSAQAN